MPAASFSTSGPTVSGAICTGLPSSWTGLGRGLEAEFRIRAALGPAQVAHQQQRRALVQHILDGRQAADALSSVTTPSCMGTLKSTRISTLALEIDIAHGFLVHGLSLVVCQARSVAALLLQLACHQCGSRPCGRCSPLVVVPGDDLRKSFFSLPSTIVKGRSTDELCGSPL